MTNSNHIQNLHRRMYDLMKKRALSYEGKVSSELRSYRQDQAYYLGRSSSPCDLSEFYNTLHSSQVIYIGDFHTFDQNLKNVMRIMKLMLHNKHKFAIGLEMVDHQDQMYVDAYLEGHLTELELLESINYKESWRFPWSHYKQIFHFAKINDIAIHALNTIGKLSVRDDFASQVIGQHLVTDPQTPILVFYGELHLLPNKIPRKVLELMANEKHFRYAIIHQNLDEIFWEHQGHLKEQGLYKYSKNEFCLISSPPWMKYESMIYWFENLNEDPDFDYHDYIITHGLKLISENTHENFSIVLNEIEKILELEIDDDELEDFNLYDHSKLARVEQQIQKIKSKPIQTYIKKLLETNNSFKFPGSTVFYCSNYSFNKVNSLAGIHLYHLLLKEKGITDSTILESESAIDQFSHLVLEQFFSYFCSKILNPYKKCNMYHDLEVELEKATLKKKKVLQTALHWLSEHENQFKLPPGRLASYYEYACILGPILGEHLYHKLVSGKSMEQIKKLLNNVDYKIEYLNELKDFILTGTHYKKYQKRFF